jgi:sugar lactone lactonase YvrE
MFGPDASSASEVAVGAPLLVDVEFGRGGTLYALSQGEAAADSQPGASAMENTGSLVRVNGDGTFTAVANGLNIPTSLEFIGNTAYVTTLAGEVWAIDGVD